MPHIFAEWSCRLKRAPPTPFSAIPYHQSFHNVNGKLVLCKLSSTISFSSDPTNFTTHVGADGKFVLFIKFQGLLCHPDEAIHFSVGGEKYKFCQSAETNPMTCPSLTYVYALGRVKVRKSSIGFSYASFLRKSWSRIAFRENLLFVFNAACLPSPLPLEPQNQLVLLVLANSFAAQPYTWLLFCPKTAYPKIRSDVTPSALFHQIILARVTFNLKILLLKAAPRRQKWNL